MSRAKLKGFGPVAAVAICLNSAIVVYAAGNGWKCQGNHNCGGATCESYPTSEGGQGYSCANITPVNHPKCEYVGEQSVSCTEAQKTCAKKSYYAGGTCEGDPSACPGGSMDVTDELKETGC